MFDPVQWLKQSKILGLPTETVYGLAGRADCPDAVALIYQLKNRPSHNPLIVHYAGIQEALADGVFKAQGRRVAEALWPGPLTVLVPKSSTSKVTARAHCNLPCLAMRVPCHPVAQDILRQAGPLAAPSANPSGRLSPTCADHVKKGFQDQVPVVEGGACEVGLESTILDMRQLPFRILRPGFFTLEFLQKKFPDIPFEEGGAEVETPGASLAHYAPHKPLSLNVQPPFPKDMGILGFGALSMPWPETQFVQLSWKQDILEAARNLFAGLHYLDASPHCQRIGVVSLPAYSVGKAIQDRLGKAASPPAETVSEGDLGN